MQLDFAFFAKAGELNQEGLFSVLGAGFNRLLVQQPPGIIPQLCLLVRVLAGDEEGGAQHRLRVQVISPSGAELPFGGEVRFTFPQPDARAPSVRRFACILNFVGMGLSESGVHEFRLLGDDRPLATLRLHCELSARPQEVGA
jgi:hypothetical protein